MQQKQNISVTFVQCQMYILYQKVPSAVLHDSWSIPLSESELLFNVFFLLVHCFRKLRYTWHIFHVLVLAPTFNPLTAKLFNLNFHSLEVVSRWRDTQLQMSENYSDLTKWWSTFSNLSDWCDVWFSTCSKIERQCANKKMLKTNIIGAGGFDIHSRQINSYFDIFDVA